MAGWLDGLIGKVPARWEDKKGQRTESRAPKKQKGGELKSFLLRYSPFCLREVSSRRERRGETLNRQRQVKTSRLARVGIIAFCFLPPACRLNPSSILGASSAQE
ncbi:hypothetical protein BDQ94DRAFT_80437 [Aspergillus welwitschiae]|uniref:Uncharacterized protein n=1 Tax=Aspergillus welwitschiae TaxID=1341132 RepID=A0A3F3PTW4_9EURO|nr:hypothetical protein BDQ94DRAFT_80437 [Aspergillus welwitschiae]RDH29736.1 hypothetical protein BDQ94DRAFT_80437 [Aspergillus welwitschiae]